MAKKKTEQVNNVDGAVETGNNQNTVTEIITNETKTLSLPSTVNEQPIQETTTFNDTTNSAVNLNTVEPVTLLKTFEAEPQATPPISLERNKYGLFNHIKYVFNEDGTVNWRAMIPNKYLYINPDILSNASRAQAFTNKYGKKPSEINLDVDKVEDKDLTILLGGIRYLANLRGMDRFSYNVKESRNDYSVIECNIDWVPNYQNPGYGSSSGVACASPQNTSQFVVHYLPEMASNRAFCRAVRNYLNIDIVSKEELGNKTAQEAPQQSNGQSMPIDTPAKQLLAKLTEHNISFEKMKELMISSKTNPKPHFEKYNSVEEMQITDIFEVLGRIKKRENSKNNPEKQD